jgi:two-component system cell cycle response regulator
LSDDEYLESTLEVTISRDMRSVLNNAPQEQALLIVLSGPRLGTRSVLGEKAVEIGRSPACHLQLDSDSVSRRHARIEWNGQSHQLLDLGSTNGTFLNGDKVNDGVLKDGDRVGIGKLQLKYVAGGNIEGAYHEEIQRLMRFDPLTGICNKRHFEESLKLAVTNAKTAPKPISLIVFDLDHFKRINDAHGHPAGDQVLCELAKVVKQTSTPDQVFGRVGGEEFAVLWEGMRLEAAAAHAEQIRFRVANHSFRVERTVLPVTVSLGVAERISTSDESPESLYERADARLYAAKAGGRNRVCS